MKTKIFYLIFIVLLWSCASNSDKKSDKDNEYTKSKKEQVNITILLDLSDRLTMKLQPNQTERDIAIVSDIVDIFKKNMESKGAFKAKDKIRIISYPPPSDPNINNISNKLTVDLSKIDNKQKKDRYDKIKTDFETGLNEIYRITINSHPNDDDWDGSDIWRFFKYDVKELCIDKNPSYRNVLVILTDGYIYQKGNNDRKGNRTTYITGSFLEKEGLRNNNWKDKFENEDYGYIYEGQTYDNLDILVLEINPNIKHKNDEDIMREYLNKWFKEMKINSFKFHNTDLPVNTKSKIDQFFQF